MRMYRRKICPLILAGLLMLTACGGDTSSESASSDASGGASSAQTSAEVSGEDAADEETQETSDTEQITFESLTVADNDECAIVITGIEADSIWGYVVNAELENKSDDVTYMFAVETASVNGLQADPYFADTVAPGKKAIEEIIFDADTLSGYGIDKITDISLSFHVYDEDDWSGNYVVEETVHVYPYGEEAAETFIRESLDTDQVLIDTEDAAALAVSSGPDDLWGYEVLLYLENRSDADVMFSIEDASVNGYMCDPYWASEVYVGTTAFSSVYWYEESLEEIGITDLKSGIESIEFTLTVYDYETYDTISSENVVIDLQES